MKQVFGSCSRYVQGYGELKNIREYVHFMGERFLIVASKSRLRDLKPVLENAFEDTDKLVFAEFGGEASLGEVARLDKIAAEEKVQCVIALGGGKIHDTCKAVALHNDIYIVIAPTIAASDAATSATGLLYNDEGTAVVDHATLNRNPDLVLVDTEIIMKAPVRYVVAGMGDALSTYLGARVCRAGGKTTHHGGTGTEVGFAIAKLSYDLLFKYGYEAKIAAEQKIMTRALNTIIEVNTLMSGLGFENNGGASDHAFCFAALALPGRKENVLHGEGVAFSCCCQLVMENAPVDEIDKVYSFLVKVGLPVDLDDMQLPDITDEEIRLMGEYVAASPTNWNHPFEITPEVACGAIRTADSIGRLYKAGGSLL